MKEKQTLPVTTLIVGGLLIAALSFYGGMKYQSSRRTAYTRQAPGNQAGQGAMFRNGNGNTMFRGANRPVSGEVISADKTSITVKMADGSSKIVLISGTTQINKASTADISDITAGMKVAVFGTTNPDGSVTAQNVQLNPVLRQDISPEASGGPVRK